MGDVLDAVSARIKAPYFGYAVLAFIAWNWRGIFLLLMTDGTPEQRLSAFDMHTTLCSLYIAPLLTGIFVAASAEWIRFGFEWVARKPRQLMSMRVLQEEHDKAVEKIKLEALRQKIDASEEEQLIERAKREDKAVQDIESEDVKQRLQAELEKRRAEKDPISEIAKSLDEFESELLSAAAKGGNGQIFKVAYIGGTEINTAKQAYGNKSARDLARYLAALESLQSKRLIEPKGSKGELFQLTAMGWDVSEKIF